MPLARFAVASAPDSFSLAARVAIQLHRLRITRVRLLGGGFDGWKDAGYPLLDCIDLPAEALPALDLRNAASTSRI